jgi:nitrate reductase beta subunit
MIEQVTSVPDAELVDAQRAMIKDPFDPEVIASAKENGITDTQIEAAQNSPVYKFVMKWKLALPLHPEFRTLPMLFYVPPMLPVLAGIKNGRYEVSGSDTEGLVPLLSSLEQARVPIRYMASLFSAGNVDTVEAVYKKLIAVRIHMRSKTVTDVPAAEAEQSLTQGRTTVEEAEAIYRLTALPTYEERFVIPPMAREEAIEQTLDPYTHKPAAGFGFREAPERRF